MYEPPPDCCGRPDRADCFPIAVPEGDTFYSSRARPPSCLEFTRTDAHCPGLGGDREQYSVTTAFLDASQVS